MSNMYILTEETTIPGKEQEYKMNPGEVGRMIMKFSRYPHIEFNMNPSVIHQLSRNQNELIENAEKLLNRLRNKIIKVSDDDDGWIFSHVTYNTSTSTVFAVCEKKVSKYITLWKKFQFFTNF